MKNPIKFYNGQGGYGSNIDKIKLRQSVTISFGTGSTIFYDLSSGCYNVSFEVILREVKVVP